ncbi:hypothetical protein L861_12535 [Litchfieldella anticariensis FP35 = DSM 16096]|uniref:DUF1232 domain-containing protein n=1 Tax=Litchfieldella anticariensis (strain DSM 16096 / CECT 5854 / CIP 108499 / LMG 22089 / FP35) TaxID=1121939 RepID=S2KH41_LITA3|nr:DUF1232 domain-containing protein [Halomonas anticariensis]EPC01392.1 hypothetical protein L861_12535 [Halomonas anticariensis FP35 = DSM 16096]
MAKWLLGSLFGRLRRRGWAVQRIGRALRLFVPMTRDVVMRRYRPVPWSAFAWMGLALAYLVMPFDLVPDVILLTGWLDDVVIVGWLLTRVDRRLTAYRDWKGEAS